MILTDREIKLIKAILDILHEHGGKQMADALLHAEVNLKLGETIPLAEFIAALNLADGNGFITSIHAKYGNGFRRNINDAGEAARLEM